MKDGWLNFAVGPVMMSNETRAIGAEQIPYFRTGEFSGLTFENERLFKKMVNAPENSKCIFMTGSGTAGMEASVMNTLTRKDKAIVINGGSFGARFCEICEIHGIPYDAILCEPGKTLTSDMLEEYDGKGYTAFIVNLCETSTGVLYDIGLISDFCRRNNLFLIVDAVSAFLCDETDMSLRGIDVIITGSQKALAIAPGLSIICVNGRAIDRICENEVKSLYFDLKSYLKNGERGQTPFTPAVGIMMQLNGRLRSIEESGGAASEIKRSEEKARYFRQQIKELPVKLFADKPSNSVTALSLLNEDISAYSLFEILKSEYKIWICPNGGDLRDKVFRVGHMGNLDNSDYDRLIDCLRILL